MQWLIQVMGKSEDVKWWSETCNVTLLQSGSSYSLTQAFHWSRSRLTLAGAAADAEAGVEYISLPPSRRCLAYHQRFTAAAASNWLSSGPSALMRIRWSRTSRDRQILRLVLISFICDKTCSSRPFAAGRQKSSSVTAGTFVQLFRSNGPEQLPPNCPVILCGQIETGLGLLHHVNHSSHTNDTSTPAESSRVLKCSVTESK